MKPPSGGAPEAIGAAMRCSPVIHQAGLAALPGFYQSPPEESVVSKVGMGMRCIAFESVTRTIA